MCTEYENRQRLKLANLGVASFWFAVVAVTIIWIIYYASY